MSNIKYAVLNSGPKGSRVVCRFVDAEREITQGAVLPKFRNLLGPGKWKVEHVFSEKVMHAMESLREVHLAMELIDDLTGEVIGEIYRAGIQAGTREVSKRSPSHR